MYDCQWLFLRHRKTSSRHFVQVLARDVAYELVPLMQRRNLHARLAEALAAASAVGATRSAVAHADSAGGLTHSAVAPADSAGGPMRLAVAPATSAVGLTRSAVALVDSAVGPTRSAVAPAASAVPAAIVAYHWSQSCRLGDGHSLDPTELPRVLKVGCCKFPLYPVFSFVLLSRGLRSLV